MRFIHWCRCSCLKVIGWCLATLTCVAGCSTGDHKHLIPPGEQSRSVLETVLTSWRNGDKMARIDVGNVAVVPTDLRWQDGKKLTGFEVLTAEPAENGLTWFTVKLKMAGANGELTARYVVLGKDPLYVFSEEAYKQLSGS